MITLSFDFTFELNIDSIDMKVDIGIKSIPDDISTFLIDVQQISCK